MLPLHINKTLVASSFGIFDSYVLALCSHPIQPYFLPNRKHVLADPTTFEEPLLETTLTVTLDESGGIVSVVQLGLGIASAGLVGGKGDILSQCIDASKGRSVDVRKIL